MTEGARIYPLQKTPAAEPRSGEPRPFEPLWREVLGRRLRGLRTERWETLAETAERAGISPQYLSEIERGLKEPSSEMIAALAGALDVTLADLLTDALGELRALQVVGNRTSSISRTSHAAGLNRAGTISSGPVALALAV
jgi:transcriptional regulator with XRE-family HTH domain